MSEEDETSACTRISETPTPASTFVHLSRYATCYPFHPELSGRSSDPRRCWSVTWRCSSNSWQTFQTTCWQIRGGVAVPGCEHTRTCAHTHALVMKCGRARVLVSHVFLPLTVRALSSLPHYRHLRRTRSHPALTRLTRSQRAHKHGRAPSLRGAAILALTRLMCLADQCFTLAAIKVSLRHAETRWRQAHVGMRMCSF